MRTKRQIIQFQIISWVIAYVLLTIVLHLFDSARSDLVSNGLQVDLIFKLRFSTLAGITIGLAMGLIDILLLKMTSKKRSFRFYITIRGLLYILVFVFILGGIVTKASSYYAEKILMLSLTEMDVKFVHKAIFAIIFYSILVSVLINFISEVSKKFGPGVLFRLLMGKYYNPRVENKIFMFMDLKSSTTYAEKLGHIKYSLLIQDCFNDLNAVVLEYKAEIYQYVGDEAVITWSVDNGLDNLNYIRFFFAFQEGIKNKAEYYLENYSIVPEFKAGVNGGNITATEVGDIKREIAYHGDVINTAARIQGVCNEFNKRFLISEFLAEKLISENGYESEEIGQVTLKGKEMPVRIFYVELAA